jgi:hypothetical protein
MARKPVLDCPKTSSADFGRQLWTDEELFRTPRRDRSLKVMTKPSTKESFTRLLERKLRDFSSLYWT